ncbi:MAG: UvrD-helicase domain-containing protein [Propionibacteriaceae bacterium]|jgi:DNA helicase IV|nr:UvrD-helicase domain-containing protein [Propionibacteriaceae bacterium]
MNERTIPPNSDQAFEHERAIEQAHVDQVYAELKQATVSARSIAAESAARYTSDRQSWLREEDGTALFERDAFAFQAARRLATLDAEHEGLVFGRLDFQDREIRYVGRIGVRTADFEPLVIDWRARAAEPFYRATAADPMGVVRRRVLQSRNDIVTGIEDDLVDPAGAWPELVVIGEGALMAALSRARGHRMRDIVSTIQAEQDEAIRAPWPGFTIIAGGPGTGKTVVALHRAAYLLYSHRQRFENGGVLVIGPSLAFMDYIERVLPSLGEDSVTLRSLGQVANDVLPLTASRLDTAAAAVIKGSLAMVPLLRRLVEHPIEELPEGGLRVTVKGEVLAVSLERLSQIRHQAISDRTYHAARPQAENQVIAELWRSRSPDLGRIDHDQFVDLVQQSSAFEVFFSAWWPALTAADVLRRLNDPAVVSEVAAGQLDASQITALATSYQPPDFSVADIALLDELAALLGAPPKTSEPDLFLDDFDFTEVVTLADRLSQQRDDAGEQVHSTYAHILVDEAQDITPMQWRMLRRRGPQASWTVVGDLAQSSWPDPAENARSLSELIGRSPQRLFRLSTNYRSPAEVFQLASDVITQNYPEADLPRAVRQTGIEPRLLVVPAAMVARRVVAAVVGLIDEVSGTIGVITPSLWRTDLSAALKRADLDLGRVVLTDAMTIKGLEYDAVVIVDPDQIVAESSGGVRILYVCLTRPTKVLVTIDPDQPGAWRPVESGRPTDGAVSTAAASTGSATTGQPAAAGAAVAVAERTG